MNCETCRFGDPPGTPVQTADCTVFGDRMPAQFLRRPAGMCGPAAKLHEPIHTRGDRHARKSDEVAP